MLGGGADPDLRGALDYALRTTFWGMVAFAVMAAIFAAMVPVRELEALSSDGHHVNQTDRAVPRTRNARRIARAAPTCPPRAGVNARRIAIHI